jgi:hypothetical protein
VLWLCAKCILAVPLVGGISVHCITRQAVLVDLYLGSTPPTTAKLQLQSLPKFRSNEKWTLLLKIQSVFEVEAFLLTCDSMRCSKEF